MPVSDDRTNPVRSPPHHYVRMNLTRAQASITLASAEASARVARVFAPRVHPCIRAPDPEILSRPLRPRSLHSPNEHSCSSHSLPLISKHHLHTRHPHTSDPPLGIPRPSTTTHSSDLAPAIQPANPPMITHTPTARTALPPRGSSRRPLSPPAASHTSYLVGQPGPRSESNHGHGDSHGDYPRLYTLYHSQKPSQAQSFAHPSRAASYQPLQLTSPSLPPGAAPPAPISGRARVPPNSPPYSARPLQPAQPRSPPPHSLALHSPPRQTPLSLNSAPTSAPGQQRPLPPLLHSPPIVQHVLPPNSPPAQPLPLHPTSTAEPMGQTKRHPVPVGAAPPRPPVPTGAQPACPPLNAGQRVRGPSLSRQDIQAGSPPMRQSEPQRPTQPEHAPPPVAQGARRPSVSQQTAQARSPPALIRQLEQERPAWPQQAPPPVVRTEGGRYNAPTLSGMRPVQAAQTPRQVSNAGVQPRQVQASPLPPQQVADFAPSCSSKQPLQVTAQLPTQSPNVPAPLAFAHQQRTQFSKSSLTVSHQHQQPNQISEPPPIPRIPQPASQDSNGSPLPQPIAPPPFAPAQLSTPIDEQPNALPGAPAQRMNSTTAPPPRPPLSAARRSAVPNGARPPASPPRVKIQQAPATQSALRASSENGFPFPPQTVREEVASATRNVRYDGPVPVSSPRQPAAHSSSPPQNKTPALAPAPTSKPKPPSSQVAPPPSPRPKADGAHPAPLTPPQEDTQQAPAAPPIPLVSTHPPTPPRTPSPSPRPRPSPPGPRVWRLEHVRHRVVDIVIKDRRHADDPPTLARLMCVNRASFCTVVAALYADAHYMRLPLWLPVPAVSTPSPLQITTWLTAAPDERVPLRRAPARPHRLPPRCAGPRLLRPLRHPPQPPTHHLPHSHHVPS